MAGTDGDEGVATGQAGGEHRVTRRPEIGSILSLIAVIVFYVVFGGVNLGKLAGAASWQVRPNPPPKKKAARKPPLSMRFATGCAKYLGAVGSARNQGSDKPARAKRRRAKPPPTHTAACASNVCRRIGASPVQKD